MRSFKKYSTSWIALDRDLIQELSDDSGVRPVLRSSNNGGAKSVHCRLDQAPDTKHVRHVYILDQPTLLFRVEWLVDASHFDTQGVPTEKVGDASEYDSINSIEDKDRDNARDGFGRGKAAAGVCSHSTEQ